jgi:UDPglucose--hexose-1-phosphate uridylyltransferase
LQYSPYEYYEQHAIALSAVVKPMKVNGAALRRLADFVELLPHYFAGSNADLPIVGGSILSHDHYQGGQFEFALDRARVDAAWDFDGLTVEVLHWPLTVLRVRGARAEVLARGEELLEAWREYSDEEFGVRAFSSDTPHNTVTPIARRVGSELQLSLALRNNRTSPDHPDGIFHPHAEIHPVKRENIGLIEVMGLAVLPARLSTELNEIALALTTGTELSEELSPHQPMLDGLRERHAESLSLEDAVSVVRIEAGDMFVRGLEHCGVFGSEAVDGCTRFLASVGWIGN